MNGQSCSTWLGRRLRAVALGIACLIAAAPARADTAADCAEWRNPKLAIPACTTLIRQDPRNAVAYYNRGQAYIPDLDRAIADYSKATELDPKYVDAHMARGFAHWHKGDNDRAFVDFSKAIEADPKYAEAYGFRGTNYAAKGDHDNAIADFSKAIELAPRAIDYVARGMSYQMKGDSDRAIADLNSAIELDPKLILSRAWVYLEAGKAAQGLPDAETALARDPNAWDAYFVRGRIHEALGRREEAIADFRSVLRLQPAFEMAEDGLRRLGVTP